MYIELPSNYSLYVSYVGVVIALLVIMALLSYFYLKDIVKYKQLNQRIINLNDNPVFWVTPKGDIQNVINAGRCEWADEEKLEVHGVNIKELLPAEYYNRWVKYANEVVKTKKSKEILMHYTTPQKEVLYIRLDIVYFDKKTLLVFERNFSEVEQERMENRKQRHMMQALLDNLPIPTTVKDVNDNRRYLIWNKGTEILYSATQEELLGNNESVLDKGLAEAFRKTDEETLTKGKSSTIQRLRLADGRIHTLSMHKTLVCYGNDKWIISSALDITEMADQRAQLNLLNKQHELILNEIGMASWTWDENTGTVHWYQNPFSESEDMLRSEAINTVKNYCQNVVPEHRERVKHAFSNLRKGIVNVLDIEYQIFDVNNQRIWLETFGVISEHQEDGTAKQVVGASYSIDERKKLQEALIAAKESAEESNRLKSAFLANMSHEIRTPLNAIVGFSGILAEKCDDEESQYYRKVIEHNNELLLQLISDILDMSKIEAGDMKFVYSNVDINECLKGIKSFAEMKAAEGVDVIMQMPLESCIINTERHRLVQVINNFVSNAIKHTLTGSIQIGYDVPKDGFIRFYVKDTGKGIPAEKANRVFDRFIQLDSFKQGAGLGLAISKTIVEKMSGTIGVVSDLGKGAEFWFTVPYQQVTENKDKPSCKLDEMLEEGIQITGLPSVLLIEDNDSSYKLYQAMLDKEFTLHHAWNGVEAVEFCEEMAPDVILMDIKAPMSGNREAEMLRKKYSNIPIVAVVANEFSGAIKNTSSGLYDAVALKPIDAEELKKAIVLQVNHRRAHTEGNAMNV